MIALFHLLDHTLQSSDKIKAMLKLVFIEKVKNNYCL